MNKIELYYQTALSQIEEQEHRRRAIDSKGASLMGITVTLAGVAVILLKNFSGRADETLGNLSIGIASAIALIAVASLLNTLRILKPREWHRRPDLSDMSRHVHNHQYDDTIMMDWMGDELRESISHNEKILNEKVNAVNFIVKLLAALTALLVFLGFSVNLHL